MVANEYLKSPTGKMGTACLGDKTSKSKQLKQGQL